MGKRGARQGARPCRHHRLWCIRCRRPSASTTTTADRDHPTGSEVTNISPYLVEGTRPRCHESRPRRSAMCRKWHSATSRMTADISSAPEAESDEFLRSRAQSAKFIPSVLSAARIHQRARALVSLACGRARRISSASLAQCTSASKPFASIALASKSADTRRTRQTPSAVRRNRQPKHPTISLVPEVSSETRAYIPIGFLRARCYCQQPVALLFPTPRSIISAFFTPQCTWRGCGRSVGG